MLRSILFIGMLLYSMPLRAQSPHLENLGIRDGLSQGFISCMLQDREGFVWIGTKNGLNRYDGRVFRYFTHRVEDPFSISADQIHAIEDFGDFLIIAAGDGVLDVYSKKKNRFYHIALPPQNGMLPFIHDIKSDGVGNIWLLAGQLATDRHIYLIKVTEAERKRWETQQTPELTLPLISIPCDNTFYFAFNKGRNTLYYNTAQGSYAVDIHSLQQQKLNWPASSRPKYLHMDREDGIWQGGINLLSHFNNGSFYDFTPDYSIERTRGIPNTDKLFFYANGNLMAYSTSEIQKKDRCLDSDALWKLPLSDPMISMMEDSSGNIWVGTNGKGIQKIGNNSRKMRSLFLGNSIYSAAYMEPNGTILANTLSEFQYYPSEAQSISAKAIRAAGAGMDRGSFRACEDKQGNYWFFMEDDLALNVRLIKISRSGVLESYALPYFSKMPGCMLIDRSERIWMAVGQSFIRFDPVTKTSKSFSLESVFHTDQENYALAQSPDGAYWLGCQGGLLEIHVNAADEFSCRQYTAKAGELPNNAVAAVLPDPADGNFLWLGTKGGGLSRMQISTRTFSYINTQNGLPNDVIYSILPDKQGNLWMSSNKGLIRYTPSTKVFNNYTEEDGIQSNEFNTWAYSIGPDGAFLFGGVNGLNVFYPEDFKDNPHYPKVFITRLSINNTPVEANDSTRVLQNAIEFTSEITLHYDQRSVSLSFAALEFTTPSKNRFKWILEGAETEWHSQTAENSATYLNLPPGTYTFKVMASNGDGLWNPIPATLKINVMPPWYRSVWAYMVYFAMIGGIIYGYVRFRLSRLRLEQRLALEKLNAERLQELDRFKSQVFTNVSHEFRTPLTVILGIVEKLKSEGLAANRSLGLIQRNSQNLLRLINQILDLAKLENNSLKINYINGDVLAFLRYTAESLHSLAGVKNVMLKVESHIAGGSLIMDYDPERLQNILYNLLSNAIKFTPPGGKVVLQISENIGQLCIKVRDTGIGIAPEALPHVFERFFQANNQQHTQTGSSGIGLSFTSELVKNMGGEIAVESELGKGTLFTVLLPITRIAPEKEATGMPLETNHGIVFTESKTGHEVSGELPFLLIIEDNPDVVEYLTVCLQEHYRLIFAYNGTAGIEQALENIPDLIVSDVMMPGKDGFQVCETLKNDVRTSHIPIVLLTAKAAVEDRIAGLKRGADAYMAKPFHPEELLTMLSNLLELRRKLQAKYAGAYSAETPARAPASSSTDPEDTFIQKLRAAVEEHITEANLSVEDISRIMGMSYPVVHRKVTALTGLSLTLYVRSIRLQKARLLLANPALSIAEVAYQTGFNDPKFFSRVFAEEFGAAPSAYRQEHFN